MPDSSYSLAREQYAPFHVDTEAALARLATIPVSMHCWQGDDVAGFENSGLGLDGGVAVTGNYPGKARNIDELRADIDKTFSLIPGKHRLALHASYADPAAPKADRNALAIEHFQSWVDWAKPGGVGLDFNPTFFSHPLASDSLTLSNPDKGIRQFWIEHAIACRKIGAEFGRQLGTPCVTNVWIPDGSKDIPADRLAPRERLARALDAVFAEPIDASYHLDAVESKLFGIGAEAYTVGSFEFYLGYAIKNQKLVCLDAGHFHPTETIADKISSVLMYAPGLLLHVSRGVRWDSDHVIVLDDALRATMEEIVRGNFLGKTHIGLDFFDATINRVAAWTIGMRNALKALLLALLEPTDQLRAVEDAKDYTSRLALMEELKTLPFGAVWDEHCRRQNVPVGREWLTELKAYEGRHQAGRK